jgi:hypothetical protein
MRAAARASGQLPYSRGSRFRIIRRGIVSAPAILQPYCTLKHNFSEHQDHATVPLRLRHSCIARELAK